MFGTTQKNKSDYHGFSDQSNGPPWTDSRTTGQGKHIKVKTEWMMHSHNLPESTSEIQLVPVSTKLEEGSEEPRPLRPEVNMASMETICKSGGGRRT